MAITPDTKDWTWVLERACPECGFDPATVRRADIADRIERSAVGWDTALARPDAKERPDENTWSVLEYGCHVRDVHRIMSTRLGLMLTGAQEDGARFANWDQDEAALAGGYEYQEPAAVAVELATAADGFAAEYRTVGDDQWDRRGLRSNGSVFTVDSLARYALHDLEHHRMDVGLEEIAHG